MQSDSPGAPLKAGVEIAPLDRHDAREFVEAGLASRALHGRWVSPPLDLDAFLQKLDCMRAPVNYGFTVRRADTRALAGYVDVTNVVRGIFLSGYVGYYAFTGHERQGLMTEGLRRVVRYAFMDLGLHRLEANMQPGNLASIVLATACGFSQEGYSPRYLKIRGRWRDHARWAIVAP